MSVQTLKALHEIHCTICNKILALNKVKEESVHGSDEYVIAVSKEIAYMECLNEIMKYK